MKAIKTQANITSISSRSDNSLRLSVVTPELTPEEQVEFIKLKNINIDLFMKPLDFEAEDIEEKTPSQRLRSFLYVVWKKRGEKGEFRTYYEKIID